MTEYDIQFLKDNIDNVIEIQTVDGEDLIAKILFVTHCEEYGEHEVLYEVVSSNMIDSYANRDETGGYVLDFENIISVRSHLDRG